MTRSIPQGEYIAPIHAAQSWIGSHYFVADGDGGEYSADPGDYWADPDDRPVGGAIVRKAHPFRTVTGRTVYAERVIRWDATVGDLRRMARAAETLVR